MAIVREAAVRAFEQLADAFGSTPAALADDAIRLANANVVNAIQKSARSGGGIPETMRSWRSGGPDRCMRRVSPRR